MNPEIIAQIRNLLVKANFCLHQGKIAELEAHLKEAQALIAASNLTPTPEGL